MKCFIVCVILFLSQLCPAKLRADINGDCRVDLADLAILISEWMQQEDCNMSLGEELIVNGGFDSASGWVIAGSGTAITGGKLVLSTGVYFRVYRTLATDRLMSLYCQIVVSDYIPVNPLIKEYFRFKYESSSSEEIEIKEGILSGTVVMDDYGGDGVVEINLVNIPNFSTLKIDDFSGREIIEDPGGMSTDVFEGLYEEE